MSLKSHYPPRESSWDPLDPNSSLKMSWDAAMLGLVVYVLFVTPFELAYVQRVPEGSTLYVCNWLVDAAFWSDLVRARAAPSVLSRPRRASRNVSVCLGGRRGAAPFLDAEDRH